MKVKRVEKEPSRVDSFISKFIIGQFEILRSQVQMSVPLCVRFFCGNPLFVHVCTMIFISYNVLIPNCHAETEFCIPIYVQTWTHINTYTCKYKYKCRYLFPYSGKGHMRCCLRKASFYICRKRRFWSDFARKSQSIRWVTIRRVHFN